MSFPRRWVDISLNASKLFVFKRFTIRPRFSQFITRLMIVIRSKDSMSHGTSAQKVTFNNMSASQRIQTIRTEETRTPSIEPPSKSRGSLEKVSGIRQAKRSQHHITSDLALNLPKGRNPHLSEEGTKISSGSTSTAVQRRGLGFRK